MDGQTLGLQRVSVERSSCLYSSLEWVDDPEFRETQEVPISGVEVSDPMFEAKSCDVISTRSDFRKDEHIGVDRLHLRAVHQFEQLVAIENIHARLLLCLPAFELEVKGGSRAKRDRRRRSFASACIEMPCCAAFSLSERSRSSSRAHVVRATHQSVKEIARHLRHRKRLHWHVDPLRDVAAECRALPIRSSSQQGCALARAMGSILTPGPAGFGSRDCGCPAHLFYSPVRPCTSGLFTELWSPFVCRRFDRLRGQTGVAWS